MATDLLVDSGPESRLSCLPLLDAGPFAQIGQKGFDILTRTMAQPLPMEKINKGLRPLDIKVRTLGTHPVILSTGLKRIPKFLGRCRFLWTFFIHKNEPIQRINFNSQFCNRQNYSITFLNRYRNTPELCNIFHNEVLGTSYVF